MSDLYDEMLKACDSWRFGDSHERSLIEIGCRTALPFAKPDAPEPDLTRMHIITGQASETTAQVWIGRLERERDVLLAAREETGRPDGVTLIAAERERQVSEEGWTAEHDDAHAGHEDMEGLPPMIAAAASYLLHNRANGFRSMFGGVPNRWPWDAEWWKPTLDDPVRNLVKAGALIAAEIDRLNRIRYTEQKYSCEPDSREAVSADDLRDAIG